MSYIRRLINQRMMLAVTFDGLLQHSDVHDGSIQTELKPTPRFKPSVDILCNNQTSEVISLYDQCAILIMFMSVVLRPDEIPDAMVYL